MDKITAFAFTTLFLFGCAANKPQTDRLTFGTIQKSVYEGANQAEIMETMGAPNIITKNSDGKEVWTYDRISREAQASSGMVVSWWNPISWLGGIASGTASRSSTTSKSITVLITFNDNKQVANFKYQRLEF